MPSSMSHSCFLIGSDSLLIECANILLKSGFDIRGIVSAEKRIVSWARSHDTEVLDPRQDYRSDLKSRPFDYLFSIANLDVIPQDILDTPEKAAINFHDGPLPNYAGLNAPVWALLNREQTYGITWHLMTSKMDAGDILEQRTFDLGPTETSLTLNTLCFENAIESFEVLAERLARGDVKSRPQDDSQRTYFGRFRRPAAGCVIDWKRSAEQLEALVRALDFGHYTNLIGAATVKFGKQVFAITAAEAREGGGSPGTIQSCDADQVLVSTPERNLALKGFSTLCGRKLPIEEVIANARLKPGASFDRIDEDILSRLTQLNEVMSRAERFWVDRLRSLVPLEIPYALGSDRVVDSGDYGCVELDIPESFRSRFAGDGIANALAAAFGAYLSRLCDADSFHLFFQDSSLRETVDCLDPWVATHVPLWIEVDALETFAAEREKISFELNEVRSRHTWLRDVVGRYPELRDLPELLGCPLPVGITFWDNFERFEPTLGSLLTFAIEEETGRGQWYFNRNRLSANDVNTMQRQFAGILTSLVANETSSISKLELLSTHDREEVLERWNRTKVTYRTEATIHQLFEEQVTRTPSATAVVFEEQELTYCELNERANKLAVHLRQWGVGPGTMVGIYLDRSLDMMVSIYATLKAGGAYVPLDPDYPHDRLAFMIEDSQVLVLLTQNHLLHDLPDHSARVFRVDSDWENVEPLPEENLEAMALPGDLAYVIYTSGSTGKPKGVMVEHRNAVNFFTGMDDCIAHDPPGTWLAVTSLSFDISVLELFWTLSRGFKVVLYDDITRSYEVDSPAADRSIDMGVFLWGDDDGQGRQKYRLLLECVKYADEHGFSSVWTPERHFHAFGGPFPNPSVTSAAVAAITSQIQIRAGCVVMPLHHPVRVAEEWAMVDNLSEGRVGLGIAAGWMPNDFIIRPENHKDKKEVMFRDLDIVRKLWRGEKVSFPNDDGDLIETVTLPRPIQPELPVWITTAGNPDSYRRAGQIGANVLTHLLGQSVEEVADKIQIYRQSREEAGLDPAKGAVTLMLHTFVGKDDETVRDIVRGPLKRYLGSAVSLVAKYAWTFPTYKRPDGKSNEDIDKLTEEDIASLTPDEADAILENAFLRYFKTSGLFGSPETCLKMIDRIKAIDVDEVACLLDYGAPVQSVIDSLSLLNQVRESANPARRPVTGRTKDEFSFAATIRRHRPTHLQCTPSMAQMLCMNGQTRVALGEIHHLLVGGEPLPPTLARELDGFFKGTVTNMYGPTETTVWSTTQSITDSPTSIPIGKPIANTRCYVLDGHQRPVPVGLPGELYIGGAGVVRGYHDRPDLTNERFLQDPFAGGAARMYRTGDLARYRADGTLKFLGRLDHQVKIRGYRIELGEIETYLNGHPRVSNGVVVAREDAPDDQRLVAYFVPEGTSPEPGNLRDHLRRKLPKYMVPNHFIELKALPLTPNGKIDRQMLPAPTDVDSKETVKYLVPRNDLENYIAKLWQETLGIDRVGVEDNFFDIGGHSLLVLRVHRQMQDAVERPVALTDLFRFPTVRSLAKFLSQEDDALAASQQGAERGKKRREFLQRRLRNRS